MKAAKPSRRRDGTRRRSAVPGKRRPARTKSRDRQSLVSRAYDAIKARILNNEYGAGFQATEPEIAASLSMSRTPVREALIQLQTEGLIEIVPRRGMRVVPLSPGDMREIYQVLTALETMAVELLTRRPATPDDVALLEDAIAAMDAALDADDLPAWAAADERFHRGLVDRCGNGRLAALASTVWDQVHRARLASLRLRPSPRQSNDEHRELLAAIQRGDAAAARHLHDRHRVRTAALLVGLLEQYQLPGL